MILWLEEDLSIGVITFSFVSPVLYTRMDYVSIDYTSNELWGRILVEQFLTELLAK